MRALQFTCEVEERSDEVRFWRAAVLRLNGVRIWESGRDEFVRDDDDAENLCTKALARAIISTST